VHLLTHINLGSQKATKNQCAAQSSRKCKIDKTDSALQLRKPMAYMLTHIALGWKRDKTRVHGSIQQDHHMPTRCPGKWAPKFKSTEPGKTRGRQQHAHKQAPASAMHCHGPKVLGLCCRIPQLLRMIYTINALSLDTCAPKYSEGVIIAAPP